MINNKHETNMKKYFFAFMPILCAMTYLTSCTKLEYDIDENYEKAEITSVSVYDKTLVSVVSSANESIVIDSEAATVSVLLKGDADITQLKLTFTVSDGAKVTPAIQGLQSLSEPKVYAVTSPNGTIVKQWTITVAY